MYSFRNTFYACMYVCMHAWMYVCMNVRRYIILCLWASEQLRRIMPTRRLKDLAMAETPCVPKQSQTKP